jgi:hypothetical protein
MRRAWVPLAVALVAGCGADSKPCQTWAECGRDEVCLPTGAGSSRSYCGAIDDKCPNGLRWSGSAGDGLASHCVAFGDGRDAATDAAPSDGRDAADDVIDAPIDTGPKCGPDGTVCAPTTDPCKTPGVCKDDVCGPIGDAADGTKCGAASDACHTDPTCKTGKCQAQGTHPDGYNYDSGNYLARCCGGAPTSLNSPGNCGACGIKCASGRCINTGSTNGQQWWCSCTASSECWSGCCADGSPSVCSPSSCGSPAKCITCPGNASCNASQTPHYWCHY